MAFDQTKLRQYLKETGITQANLAYLVGKDIRTIRRWLSPRQRLTLRNIDQICQALDVAPEQFDPESSGARSDEHNVQIGARVSVAAANGYTLLKKKYGVTNKQLIELAPVMFSIIARRAFGLSNRLEQNLANAKQVIGLANVRADIDPFGEHQMDIKNAKTSEEKGWLFGDENDVELDHDWPEKPTNLFCSELNKLLKDFEGVKSFSDFGGCPTSIGFLFLPTFIDEITCGDTSLKERIGQGDINLGLMDEHLWHPEKKAERVAWLKREALKSEERRRIKHEAWRKANPEQAKARDALSKRIELILSKADPFSVKLEQKKRSVKW